LLTRRPSSIVYNYLDPARSGLGLAAQQSAIENFAKAESFRLAGWHPDIETGKGSDALGRRPGLAAVPNAARAARASVIVAKLDRLSRDVHFISGLMAHREVRGRRARSADRSLRSAPICRACRERAHQSRLGGG
jgi:DNA invertase Pin-like site-specific DNA recombinase